MKTQRKIELDMSDKERYKALKRRVLTVTPCKREQIVETNPTLLSILSMAKRKDAQPLLKKLAEEFDAFGEYANKDMALTFNYGRKSLEESTSKQRARYDDYALMLSNFDAIVQNAIGIEAHKDRYKTESNLKEVCVMVSAFSDGARICPVKLEVKHFQEGQQNKLHIAITKTEIKKADVFAGRRKGTYPSDTTPLSAYNISIRQLFKKINTLDADLLKYIPKKFLGWTQRRVAEDARAAERLYIKNKLAESEKRKLFKGKAETASRHAPKDIGASIIQGQTKPQRIKTLYGKRNNGK